MAMAGLRPVVAVYSTFFSRAFDQANLDVGLHRPAGGVRARPGRHHRRRRPQPPRRPRHVPGPVHPGHDRVRPLVGPGGRGHAGRGPDPATAPRSSASRRRRPAGRPPGAVGSGLAARLVHRGDGSVCLLAVGKMVDGGRRGGRQAGRRRHRRHRLGRPGGLRPRSGHAGRRRRHGLVVTVEDGIREGGAGTFLVDAMRGLERRAAPRRRSVIARASPAPTSPRASPTASSPELGLDGPGMAARSGRVDGGTRRLADERERLQPGLVPASAARTLSPSGRVDRVGRTPAAARVCRPNRNLFYLTGR